MKGSGVLLCTGTRASTSWPTAKSSSPLKASDQHDISLVTSSLLRRKTFTHLPPSVLAVIFSAR